MLEYSNICAYFSHISVIIKLRFTHTDFDGIELMGEKNVFDIVFSHICY